LELGTLLCIILHALHGWALPFWEYSGWLGWLAGIALSELWPTCLLACLLGRDMWDMHIMNRSGNYLHTFALLNVFF
jgi:hypothetical protein